MAKAIGYENHRDDSGPSPRQRDHPKACCGAWSGAHMTSICSRSALATSTFLISPLSGSVHAPPDLHSKAKGWFRCCQSSVLTHARRLSQRPWMGNGRHPSLAARIALWALRGSLSRVSASSAPRGSLKISSHGSCWPRARVKGSDPRSE